MGTQYANRLSCTSGVHDRRGIWCGWLFAVQGRLYSLGLVCYLVSQVNYSVGQSVFQSVGQWISRLVSQSVSQPASWSIGRSVIQSVSRWVSWSVGQSASMCLLFIWRRTIGHKYTEVSKKTATSFFGLEQLPSSALGLLRIRWNVLNTIIILRAQKTDMTFVGKPRNCCCLK